MNTGRFGTFLLWEARTKDTIDFKKIYVDMSGDLVAGLMLSQIIYWHLNDDKGKTRLRVRHDGHLWLAKADKDWWDEIRITAKQARRARQILEERGIIATALYRFAGAPTTHIRVNDDLFMDLWEQCLPGNSPFAPEGKTNCPAGQNELPSKANESASEGRTCTESTAESTAQSTESSAEDGASVTSGDVPEKTVSITRPGFQAVLVDPGVQIHEVELEPYDIEPTIDCPCGESWSWPRTEKKRRDVLICPQCGTHTIVHAYRTWGSHEPYTYSPRSLPKREWVVTIDAAKRPFHEMRCADDGEVQRLVQNWDLDSQDVLHTINGWMVKEGWIKLKMDEAVSTLNAALKSRRKRRAEWNSADAIVPDEPEQDAEFVTTEDGMVYELVEDLP